jgi:Pvc16 N-terminal domain
MSNYLAIAAVTAALQQVLLPPVKQAVGGADVGFNRPDPANSTTPLVNIFLYQITPNAAYRNADLPTRRSDGTLAQVPQAAYDLHYLFTFHGDDTQLQPQMLLGAVVTTLHAQPLLSTDNINNAVKSFKALTGSGLENQIERIRFTPTALTLEEFSKLWSVFFQVEYSLSAAFQASVVLMESSDVPTPAPPVIAPNIYVFPFQTPYISQVVAQSGANDPITTTSTLLIQGQQLRGQTTLLLIENQEFTPTAISDAQLTLPAPSTIHAGIQGVQVLQKSMMGTPAVLHRGMESNIAPFVLRPTITNATAVAAPPPPAGPGGANVTLTLKPNIGIGQRAVLLLNNFAASPATAFVSKATVASADSNQITINIANVPSGKYVARVQVDGAESLLTIDSGTKLLTGPTVTMP